MKRFDPEQYYRPQDEEMRLLSASPNVLAQWRHRGVGPSYTTLSGQEGGRNGRIIYLGRDLNEWMDERRIETRTKKEMEDA